MAYFNPWRRKIGVLTLLMACLFASGWIRSCRLNESVILGRPNPIQFQFASSDGYLKFGIQRDSSRTGSPIEWQSDLIQSPHNAVISDPMFSIVWRCAWLGFYVGRERSGRVSPVQRNYVIMPYWSIVPPLTALSAWLLLSKPRLDAKPFSTTKAGAESR